MEKENYEQAEEELNRDAHSDLFEKKPLTEEEKKKKKRNKIIWIIIFIVLNVLVIGYTAITEFGGKSADKYSFNIAPDKVPFIIAGFGCLFLSLALETIKYLVMMKGLKVKVSLRAAFETAALGKYYDSITPSGVGGQPFQIYNMHKEGYSDGTSAAMPLTQFLMMQLGFVTLAVVTFIFKNDAITDVPLKYTAYLSAACYLVVPGLIVLFTISRKAGVSLITGIFNLLGKLHILKKPQEMAASVLKSMDEYRDSMIIMRKNKGILVKTYVLSVIYQIALCSIPFFVLMAFNGSASYIDSAAMVVFVYSAITIVPTPGNAGAAEGVFYILFSELDPSGLFWSMLIWRFICFYTLIILGVLIYAIKALRAGRNWKKSRREE